MSILIDNLVQIHTRPDKTMDMIRGRWYLSKPCLPYVEVWMRVKDALRVLRGLSIAVHYAVDAPETLPPYRGIPKKDPVHDR
jgi:hypothetical protein